MQSPAIAFKDKWLGEGTSARSTGPRIGTVLLRVVLALLVCSLIVFAISMIVYGYSYYKTPLPLRYRSDLHSTLKPSGHIGETLGMIGTGMLVGLLAYSARKRFRFMKNWGKLSTWLHFHIFMGFAGPVLITFHSALKLRGIVAISYWSMMIVMLSGMVGKYLYAQINSAITDHQLEYADLQKQIESINHQLRNLLSGQSLAKLQSATDFHSETEISSWRAAWMMISDDIRWLVRKYRIQAHLSSIHGLSSSERSHIYKMARTRELLLRRIALLRNSQQLFKYWHIFHLPLAQMMYITMTIHIVVVVLTGYL